MTHRRIVVSQKPQGKLTPDVFRLEETTLPAPKAGEVLVRVRYLSIDAANRAWLQGRTYRAEVASGTVMPGLGLGEVIASADPSFREGDLVEGDFGWQEYAVAAAHDLARRNRCDPLTHLLSVYGVTGLTAYFGLLEIGRPNKGETVVVSAAAGAVGSMVGQIAALKGARVVGIAGSSRKCEWIRTEIGFHEAVDHREADFPKALRAACPDGIDVYFDNVGGPVLDAALFRMNRHGRVVCCGAVSQYDGAAPSAGPRAVPGMVIIQRLRMEGFLVDDFYDRRAQAEAQLAQWVAAGRLRVIEDVVEGLENAPRGLIGLLSGENLGKRIVHVT